MDTSPGAKWATRELQARRQELLATLNSEQASLADQARVGRSRTLGGPMDDEIYAQNRDLIIAIGETHFEELVRVDTALEAIEAGTWGSCTGCGKLIEADRLMVQPTASRCVKCQTIAESVPSAKDKTPSL